MVFSAAVSGLKGGRAGKTRQCRAWLNDSSEPHPGTQQEIRLGSSAGVEGDALCYSFMMR